VSAERAVDGSLSGRVAGQLPAALLALVWRESNPRGRLDLRGEIRGSDAKPRFEGSAEVENGSLLLPGLPGPVTAINGIVTLMPEVIGLSGVRFAYGGGAGTCDGRVVISPAIELDLAVKARNVRWPVATGFAPSLTGELRVAGTLEALTVSGEATLLRTVYRRELNLQKLILEGLLAPTRATATAGSNVVLNLAISVPGTLETDTPLARLAARGDLRLVGTAAQPALLGRLEVLPGAELELSGVRYELDRGTVTFTNPERIEPYLDLLARATVQSWEITVGLVGTLDRLTPAFSSNPPLPEMDIVALLSVGKRAEDVGQVQAGTVASTFLAEQLTGAVTRRARTLLAVDQLRVDPITASESGTPTARLTVAKQLSRDWSVTVSTNLASNREEVVVSRWRLGPGVYVEASRDTDGSYSMEVKWQRRY
ncbi:MAG: translocation/assembly module TamB domain-containing protein, partial [Acidobacteriota bacterium]